MIERTSCRGVRCRGKTNSVALCSQTMNQRAPPRLRFIHEFRRPRPSWVYTRVRDERSDRGLRDRKTEDRRKKEKSNWEGKGEREKRLPRPEIAVSILAFINTSVAALKVLASSVSTRTNEKPTMKGRGCGNTRSAINLNAAMFDRPNLFISRTIRTEGGERSNLWRSTRMDRRGKFARDEACHSYVINCPVELGHDSN